MSNRNVMSMSAGYCLSSAFLLAVATLGVPSTATAQSVSDLQTPKSPLVLKAQGSLVVGGELVEKTPVELGRPSDPPGQHIVINQMYVEYMIPNGGTKVPVVMVHGGGLSGKSFETTPDGRMGWDEYFVRKGHPVYNGDQVWRARSSFDPSIYNKVREGLLPPNAQPVITRTSAERAWVGFRFGPSFGVPFPDTQFPVEHAIDFSKQGTADLSASQPVPNPINRALSDLAKDLNGAVLMGHSQSGFFPVEAVLTDPTGIKGQIILESAGCNNSAPFYTDAQIATLATVPMLIMFGDHLEADPSRQMGFNNCKAFIDRINAAGGNATMIWPPDLGINGNTHMFMLDKNNLQLADLIMKWIDDNIGKRKVAKN